MSPRLRIFAIVFALLFWGVIAKVCFGYDDNAGMVAARITGQTRCLWVPQKHGLTSVAVFPFRGVWWVYHPEFGSCPTAIPASAPMPQVAKPSLWAKVLSEPKDADLSNGCLPRAIAKARRCGGTISIRNHHAEVVNR